jgi:hypothetical protein
MVYQLGVDLGTTYTAAAIARDGRAEAVTLGTNSMAVPSVVYLGDGGLVVGHAAQRRATTDPSRVAREFKRRVGDPTPILVGGSPVPAELLMARLLHWVVDQVATGEGGPPESLAVTHPANWGLYKLDLLGQAIRHVGLTADRLVPEPVAAATFYASQRELRAGSVIAVYDLGGGTFDAAVVRSGPEGFEIIGQPDGIERLGGIDFDLAVLRHTTQMAGIDLDALDPDDPGLAAAINQLRDHCVIAKEALSAETTASIPVALPGLYTEVRLTRSEFEDMIRPALDETLVALRRAIASAQLTPADVSAVLLVGGSSRIPLVAQLVTADLELPIAVDARPKDAIPLGAALTVAAASNAPQPPAVSARAGDVATAGTTAPAHVAPIAPVGAPGGPSAPAAPAPAAPAPAAPLAVSRPAHRQRRRPPRMVGAALITSTLVLAGFLAWRTSTDGSNGQGAALVSVGANHTCGLRTDNTVTCWGSDDDGQASPPEGEQFIALSAGEYQTCGIRTDDTAICWGARSMAPDDPFTSISAGRSYACGIRPDDTVTCWGEDNYGQVSAPDGPFTSISAGQSHVCGIRTDDTIACWGNDVSQKSSPPSGDFVELDADEHHTCAIRTDGTVACWGADNSGETSPPEDEQFTSISAGSNHTCGLRSDDTVACWGSDLWGQTTPPEDERFTSISAGAIHNCGVTTGHDFVCWGGDRSASVSPPDES